MLRLTLLMPVTVLEKWFTVLVEKSRGGRPPKGKRQLLGTRVPVPLARAARNRADELGMTMSDYLEMLIARDANLRPFRPTENAASPNESPSHSEVLEAVQCLMDTIRSQDKGAELVLRVAANLIQKSGPRAQGTLIESGDLTAGA
jgi:antitoxin component of RelBE/YafQ-DinJ toxin-antitoxin module